MKKRHAETSRRNPPASARFLACMLILALGPNWCGVARADGLRPSASTAPDSGSIPHGIARPCQRATMSAPLQGMLVEVLVKAGARVKKGQVLAVMDNRIAKAAVNAARAAADRTAEVDHSKHALALARSLLARHSALQDAQAGAEFELEQARAQRDQADATLASAIEAQLQAKRNLELEQSRLEAHTIRAPFDGEVVRIEATVGTTLTATDKLLTLVCMDSLEAELHLPLELFGELHPGQSYRLWAFAPVSGHVGARLASASPVIDTASKTFRCLFTIDNRDRRLPAGFGVRFDSSHPESNGKDAP